MNFRVSDFIAKRLKYLGCQDVFMVTGGAAMHLNDSLAREFKKGVHNLHHEQSCAMAADSYGRILFKPAILNVTAGPGAINAINGVFGAYVDSLPMIVISGQAKVSTMMSNYDDPNVRQLGDQEVDIVSMVKKVTKFSYVLKDPFAVADIIDECFIISTQGRMGPVWIDVPIDIQATPLPEKFQELVTREIFLKKEFSEPFVSDEEIEVLAHKLLSTARPTLYVGGGVRLSESVEELLEFLKSWPLATVTGWNNNDLLSDDNPSYCGRPGSVGNRAGNFAIQFSDCVLTVGCRLNIRQLSFNWNSFARNAWTCHLDIDECELNKPFLNTNLKIVSTAKGFFPRLSSELEKIISLNSIDKELTIKKWQEWRVFCKKYLNKFHALKEANPPKTKNVNPYRFINSLTSKFSENSITVCADGTACVVGFQASIYKKNQRMFHNSGCASMGYEIPAAIGAYYAKKQTIYCIAGDGSIMMNLQELAYIGGLNLPIKIYLLNNKGYHSIRQTQNNYFPDNPVGCGIESGLPFPNFEKLADGFGLEYLLISEEKNMDQIIKKSIQSDKPTIIEILIDLEQEFVPKLASKKLEDGSMVTAELEDMSPLLSDQEMNNIRCEALKIK